MTKKFVHIPKTDDRDEFWINIDNISTLRRTERGEVYYCIGNEVFKLPTEYVDHLLYIIRNQFGQVEIDFSDVVSD